MNHPAIGDRCYILLESWAGRTRHDGVIVGETPKFYKVKMDRGAFRWGDGEIRRIRKEHVRFDAGAPR